MSGSYHCKSCLHAGIPGFPQILKAGKASQATLKLTYRFRILKTTKMWLIAKYPKLGIIILLMRLRGISSKSHRHDKANSRGRYLHCYLFCAPVYASCNLFCLSQSFCNFFLLLFVTSSPSLSFVGSPSSSHSIYSAVRNISL